MALICGAVIGLERQFRGKPVGIRTSTLICLGTALFVYLGISYQSDRSDPTRVLAQVATGVGFMGAGVILNREGLVKGVTSAACIWILAAIGSAIGMGHYALAIATSLVTVGVLVGVEWLEKGFKALRRGVHTHESR